MQKQEEEEDKRFLFLFSLSFNLLVRVTFCHSLRLASLEAGQRDASDYIKWQEEMRQRAAAEKLADIERKHLVSTRLAFANIASDLCIPYFFTSGRAVEL